MKVQYETEHKPGWYREFHYNLTKPKDIEFCCERMKEVWNGNAISFNEESGKVDISHTEFGYEHDVSYTHYPIALCPFCGEKIELIETKRTEFVKKTEKHEVAEDFWEPIQP